MPGVCAGILADDIARHFFSLQREVLWLKKQEKKDLR
jgi:hypothetical protein